MSFPLSTYGTSKDGRQMGDLIQGGVDAVDTKFKCTSSYMTTSAGYSLRCEGSRQDRRRTDISRFTAGRKTHVAFK